jgi:formiminotetrahydrofolate cyclodeaminase
VKLDELSIRDFVNELASAKATPGGGSIAALCGALGTALSAMVAGLTRGKERFEDRWAFMEEIASRTDRLRAHFLDLVQQDADAYQEVVAALKLSRETEQQGISRGEAIQASLKKAAAVPLETLRASEGAGRSNHHYRCRGGCASCLCRWNDCSVQCADQPFSNQGRGI